MGKRVGDEGGHSKRDCIIMYMDVVYIMYFVHDSR